MIAVRSAHDPDHLRGMGLDFAVLDEAAFMQPLVWAEVVRPMLLERRGGAMFLSTPVGRNWFWSLFKLGLDPEQAEWRSFHFRSHDNPLIAAEELAEIERVTPERVWRSEYLAQFVEDSGQVFRGLREAADAPVGTSPQAGRRYVAGVDWGREQDYTCIVIVEADSGRMVALDRFRQARWSLQRERLAGLCALWQPRVIWAEANSMGTPNIEALQEQGLPVRAFTTNARSKRDLIEGLALAIERGDVRLLPDEVLLGELAAYGLHRLPEGGYRYGAPSGAHDDTVMALALAWYGAKRGGVMIDFA